ncbi:MAG: SpoIIE family protein phosphatase [Planctomycetota bacterium]|jgi:sigma-B regulation protein RsbU (phosphoserine phosphatase)
MRIRVKLLILLLAIALGPLIASTVMHRQLTRRLGRGLSSGRREILERGARIMLQHVVNEYGAIVKRDKYLIQSAVEIQAREVERRLADSPPSARTLLLATDFDNGGDVPGDTARSPMHKTFNAEGKQVRMRVAYSDQAYLPAAGVDSTDITDEMMRLVTMPEVYSELRQPIPYAIKWQYTSMEAGFHTTYPSHGGYPSDYDPRKRHWYTETRDAGTLTWIVITDVTTGLMTLTAAKPVYSPDGAFAGVTAIDVPMTGILEVLNMPAQWGNAAMGMFVAPGRKGTEEEGKVAILVQASEVDKQRDWRKPVEVAFLDSDDPEQFAELMADALAGNSGVRRMSYRGRDALWAYSGVVEDAGEGFPVVIVPYDTIMAPAVAAQQQVLGGIGLALRATGAGLLLVVMAIAVLATMASRTVTRPISLLTDAAADLAGGNFDAQVEVRGKDEIGELGEIFNDMGPKLREREKLKHSLELAMEVQQHLLPEESPELDGFDVAGKSIYCDETGGDYYDFIDLLDMGPGKLGVAVGDVTGHGIGAALLMASARAVLRSQAGHAGGDLSGLFELLNHHLVRDTGDARFMTLFYGLLDSDARTLSWTSGGHDPALWLRRATGAFEELPNLGIPLGILEGQTFEASGPITLATGDVVVIGTDGIWEAANEAGEMFGKDRLREIIAAKADEAARYIYAAIVDAVRDHLGDCPQEDDITLVAIKAM